jgi:phosphoglycolate phosphatase-like HAD superfamily hydrolase
MVLDCDGVLVDCRESYDAAIAVTLERLFSELFGLRLPWREQAMPLVDRLRRTGGFNNDWDTAYALALFASCSLHSEGVKLGGVGRARSTLNRKSLKDGEVDRLFSTVSRLLKRFEASDGESGQSGIDSFVATLSSGEKDACSSLKKLLGYPGTPPSSLLATLFDEIYHGPTLYDELYRVKPRFYRGRGLIERDRLLVTESELGLFKARFDGKLALATGRPRKAAEYSLGKLTSYFNLEASVFIGDADVPSSQDKQLVAFRKPSGLALVRARDVFETDSILYVGDSAEDLGMAKNARRSGVDVSFVATYGTSYRPREQMDFFKHGGADLIIPSLGNAVDLLK